MAEEKESKDELSWKFTLTVGSKYRVTSLGTKDMPIESTGIFAGYTMVGNMDGLVLRLDIKEKGKEKGGTMGLRIIPSHMILAIDVISVKKGRQEKDDATSADFYR